MSPYLTQLLATGEAAIQYNLRLRVLGEGRDSAELITLQHAIPTSPTVQALLAERDADGRLPHHPYTKWLGAHWVLVALADLDYPPGDAALIPLREQVLDWLLGQAHTGAIRTIAGRVRRCASQEGNALYALLKLGLADERSDELAARLARWQWPDGGWNCDKRPAASHSSFNESLIPLRALSLYARLTGHAWAHSAAERAADLFLSRRLFRRLSDGAVIDPAFLQLHYPAYWHYDVLSGLKVLAEAGYVTDPRCVEALDWLVGRELSDGGWPADARYYYGLKAATGRSRVHWGGAGKRANGWVSADAFTVLSAAGRLSANGS